MKIKFKLILLVSFIFFSAHTISQANNIQLMLQDNQTEIEENKQRNKTLDRNIKSLKLQRKTVKKKLQKYQQTKKKYQYRLKKEKQNFNHQKSQLIKITGEYIELVHSLSENTTEQELLLQNLLQTHEEQDAVIVYQIGESLVSQQNKALDNIRKQTVKVYDSQQKTLTKQEQLQDLVHLEKNGLQANQVSQESLRREKEYNNQSITFLRYERQQLKKLQEESEFDSMNVGRSEQDPLLTPGQWIFSHRMSALTGLDVNVIKAWVLAEMSDSHAKQREDEDNHNWLNIGYYDKLQGDGAFQTYSIWGDPINAAKASAALLENKFLAISPSIQQIIHSRDKPVSQQLKAIYTSNWASSHYYNGESLKGTYKLVTKEPSPPAVKTIFKSPKDNKTYHIGR